MKSANQPDVLRKKSPVRPKYKYDKNYQSGSSSEKENPDPKKQMIYEANEAPSTEVVTKLQVKQITSTGTNESTNESTNEGPNEDTNEDTEFKSSN